MSKKFAFLSLAAIALLLQGCIYVPLGDLFATPYYREVTVHKGKEDKILILDIDGVITSGIGPSSPLLGGSDSTVTSVGERLDLARKDDSIKAIVLRVDSPGGTVTASDIIYKMLADYKKEKGIPIYVSMLDMAASGGYYISMAGDEIYAHPTTITGSIGVLAVFLQFHDLGQKIGVYAEVIKSGANKNITGGFENMTDEQREILQTTIDELYERFLEVVMTGRPHIAEQHLRQYADGRIFTAKQAEAVGLIDGVMYLPELLEYVQQQEGLIDPQIVLYRKTNSERIDSVYAKATMQPVQANAAAPSQVNVGLVNIPGMNPLRNYEPAFHYIWIP